MIDEVFFCLPVPFPAQQIGYAVGCPVKDFKSCAAGPCLVDLSAHLNRHKMVVISVDEKDREGRPGYCPDCVRFFYVKMAEQAGRCPGHFPGYARGQSSLCRHMADDLSGR